MGIHKDLTVAPAILAESGANMSTKQVKEPTKIIYGDSDITHFDFKFQKPSKEFLAQNKVDSSKLN
jgi:hypothetical protein